MNTDLIDALHARADRAPATPEFEDVVTDARDRADRVVRRRRNLVAAGGGSLAIVALTAAVIAAAPTGRPDSSAPAERTPVGAAPAEDPDLVAVAPAPRAAEVSIGLVPTGWMLLSYQGPDALYGPPRLAGSNPDDFAGKLLVSVHERIGTQGSYPLTVAGHPASYQDGDGADYDQGVDVVLDDTTEVNIQVPPSALLTRADILRLADTLDVRSTAEKSHG